MAGAYTLAKSGHVRGDVLWLLRAAHAATIDLILYIAFFVPGVIALTYGRLLLAPSPGRSTSTPTSTAEGPPIYPFRR